MDGVGRTIFAHPSYPAIIKRPFYTETNTIQQWMLYPVTKHRGIIHLSHSPRHLDSTMLPVKPVMPVIPAKILVSDVGDYGSDRRHGRLPKTVDTGVEGNTGENPK